MPGTVCDVSATFVAMTMRWCVCGSNTRCCSLALRRANNGTISMASGTAHVGGTRAEMWRSACSKSRMSRSPEAKHENVTWSLVMRGENRQFGACASVPRWACPLPRRPGCDVVAGRSVRKPGNMPHQRGSASQRLIADRDRVRAAGDLDYRYLGAQCVFEMLLELRRIDCRGGDDELQVATQRQQGGEIASRKSMLRLRSCASSMMIVS